MSKLTEIIVKRPVSAVIFIAAIIIFGATALNDMPQELTPELEYPMVIVYTVYPNAGPEDVEKLVTREIESAVGAISGVRRITSNSMENFSLVIVLCQYDVNIDIVHSDVKTALDGLVNTLPSEARTPVVMQLDINSMPTMRLSVTSETRDDLLLYVEDEVVPHIRKLSSVSNVSISGGVEDYIRVEVKEDMLSQHGLSMQNIVAAVTNVDYSAPLGTAGYGDSDLAVRTEVVYEDLNEMRNIPITLRGGETIRLSDVAEVYISSKNADSISRYNGADNISLGLQKRQTASADRVSSDMEKVLETLKADNPDLNIEVVYDASNRISSALSSVTQTMLLAIALSMLVLFLFFGDFRASFIVGSSMPVSLLITFIFMNFMGFSLNIVSMSGLVLGVGMVVDNAVVVIDSCFRSQKSEKFSDVITAFDQSAVKGTKFVILSLVASTLTTAAAFLPLSVMSGMSGQLFRPLGFAIIFAIVASLFSAITLVPLFFARFKPIEKTKTPFAKLFRKLELGYAFTIKKMLPKKKTVVGIVAAFLTLSVFLAGFLNFEMMPSSDTGIIDLSIETKPGLKIENQDKILSVLEEMVATHPDVDRYVLSTGGAAMFSIGPTGTSLTAYLKKERVMNTDDIIEEWRNETRYITDCDINIAIGSDMGMGGAASSDTFDILLLGDDFERVKEAADMVVALMEEHPDIIRASSNIDRADPQAEIVVDPLLAASKNLTPQLVTASVYMALNGNEAAKNVRVKSPASDGSPDAIGGSSAATGGSPDERKYSIWVQYPKGKYETISDIENMNVVSSVGGIVPLNEVATIRFTDSPQSIMREEGEYAVTVTGTPRKEAIYTAPAEISLQVEQLTFPQGVSTGQGMEEEMETEELAAMGMAVLTTVLLVFMIMAVQFESIRYSLMVMLCIPFAAIGSFTFMFLSGTSVSMVSMLGFLILVGVVVNNGILFVDTANQYRKSMNLKSALVKTGKTRLRPILMTTITTILSMVPLSLGIGEGADMMQGLGITVIGGLTASVLLALFALPTFYLILDGNAEKREERKRRRIEKRVAVVERQSRDS
ncbi:MAG: efflux RND transporter permease subunit [Oscillospiraceae bacterium]|nr:efflux RND transporter permease subunit [Oscillospiraceae bacterium]